MGNGFSYLTLICCTAELDLDMQHINNIKSIKTENLPFGLWLYNNNHSPTSIEICYNISIDMEKILQILNFNDLSRFIKEYYSIHNNIKWTDVFKKYDGIFFKNVHKIKKQIKLSDSLKSDFIWYMDLNDDCCCINNTSCIFSIIKH